MGQMPVLATFKNFREHSEHTEERMSAFIYISYHGRKLMDD